RSRNASTIEAGGGNAKVAPFKAPPGAGGARPPLGTALAQPGVPPPRGVVFFFLGRGAPPGPPGPHCLSGLPAPHPPPPPPAPGMRRAIAEAVVGDDVFGDDPTVQQLEARIAALTGKEAAVYVVSGTMGNQLAVKSQTQPGDEVLLEADSHIFGWEAGGVAALSGCQTRTVRGTRGAISPEDVVGALRDDNDHVPP